MGEWANCCGDVPSKTRNSSSELQGKAGNLIGVKSILGKSTLAKQKQFKSANLKFPKVESRILLNQDIEGSTIESTKKLKPKTYNLLDYSDVTKTVSSKRYSSPNHHSDLNEE